jgi:predicted PurR-regulated permease PerM
VTTLRETTGFPSVLTVAAAAIVIAGMHAAREVLIPIALSVLLSFLLAPLVQRLERWRIRRVPAVVAVVSAAVLVLAGIGWFVLGQMTEIAGRWPVYKEALVARVEDVKEAVGGRFGGAAALVQDIGGEGTAAPEAYAWNASDWIRGAVWPTIGALGFGAIVALFVALMLLQRDGLRERFIWLVSDRELNLSTQMLEEASDKVSRYLLAQLTINTLQGLLVGIGLYFIGVPDSLLWGLMAGLLRFVPYVGPWVSALCPILVSLAVFEGWTRPLMTIALFVVLELFSNNIVEPWMYAARTGMSSLAILVSALFWTWIWGGFGLVLATPLTVCLVVMGKYVHPLRGFSVMLGDAPVLSAAARLYQRVLANDQPGARDVVDAELRTKPLIEVCDEILLPALGLAAKDCRLREVDEAQRERVENGFTQLVEGLTEGDVPAAGNGPTVAVSADAKPRGRILCLPTTDAFDEAAARMLCLVLRRDGFDCDVLSSAYTAGEIVELLATSDVDVACVSHIPPPAAGPIRYLCKRLSDSQIDLPVIVGAWTGGAELARGGLRLPDGDQFHVALSLAQARTHASLRRSA